MKCGTPLELDSGGACHVPTSYRQPHLRRRAYSGRFGARADAHQLASQPIVTAENEPWYLSGEPLTCEGNFYYPVGPLTAFNRNEMVRSGFYRGIPLYARTTYEPWSVVFVPLPGGFMRPYVRRRSGESFPVSVRGDDRSTIYVPVASTVRALVAPYSK